MLTQELEQLAQAGGAAVVQAAGADAWQTFRRAVARWFGRGDAERERDELERIAGTAVAVEAATPAEAERVVIRQEALWQARIEALLESLADDARPAAAEELRTLLAARAPAPGGVFAPGGLVVQGSMTIRADQESISAGILHGGAHIYPRPKLDPPRPPSAPDPLQG